MCRKIENILKHIKTLVSIYESDLNQQTAEHLFDGTVNVWKCLPAYLTSYIFRGLSSTQEEGLAAAMQDTAYVQKRYRLYSPDRIALVAW